MEKQSKIQQDIKNALETDIGWDEIEVLSIEKFGKELSVKTSAGEIFITARKFFEQFEFRARVFEEAGIFLPKVKADRYHKWLKFWTENLTKDLKIEDSDLIDTAESMIADYLEQTTETDEKYLKAGRPVLLDDDSVAFRSLDIMNHLKTEGVTVTNDQVYFILRKMHCKPRRVLKNTLRVWVWKPWHQNHYVAA